MAAITARALAIPARDGQRENDAEAQEHHPQGERLLLPDGSEAGERSADPAQDGRARAAGLVAGYLGRAEGAVPILLAAEQQVVHQRDEAWGRAAAPPPHDERDALEGEGAQDRLSEGGRGEAGGCQGGRAERPLEVERALELARQALIEEADHHWHVRPDAPGVQGGLDVDQVLVGGRDEQPGGSEPRFVEDLVDAGVARHDPDAEGFRGPPPLLPRLERDDHDLFAQAVEELDHPVSDISQSADDAVSGHPDRYSILDG
ncbi:MAG TPA: hypothetical protein VNW71_06900 [Thermoanaerobaculia bacterium]|nr:hypothetical protein [Thermoanaerobaculia bacterium]